MIAKTEAGVEKPARVRFDLAILVREACELFETTAEDRGLALACAVPEECFVQGDARMLQRLLANLLDNAIKYTPAGGRIEASIRKDAKGLSANNLDKIALTIWVIFGCGE